MISGKFNRWNIHNWSDGSSKVEPTYRSSNFYDDEDTEPIYIDITLEDDSEDSESETEESYYYQDSSETFAWFENEKTITANGNVEITLKRVVNKDIIGYNKKGEIQEVKTKPRILKII